MRYLFLILLALTACSKKPQDVQIKEFVFGDQVKLVSGSYENSDATVLNEIRDEYKQPCQIHQYYARITRNGLAKEDYICHEDMRLK